MIYDSQKSQSPLQGWLSSHSLALLVTMEMWVALGWENESMGQSASEASCHIHGSLLASECFEGESHQTGHQLSVNHQGKAPPG